MPLFLTVNAIFIVTFIFIAIEQPALWVWAIFVACWSIADYFVIKKTQIHLSIKQWALLLGALTVIDLVVLASTGQLPFLV